MALSGTLSSAWMIVIYIAAAVLPAVFLMHYVYEKDTVEKEPASLLWRLVLAGIEAAIIAALLETILEEFILPSFSFSSETMHAIADALCIGLIEEGAKFLLLYRRTWRNPNFNYLYDGIVYAVFVSLGFAALENVIYIFEYGLSIAFSRAVLAIPAHFGFAVFMGSFYGRAKLHDVYGNNVRRTWSLMESYLFSVFLHALYDGSIMIGTDESMTVFILFVIAMYWIVIHKVKRASAGDQRIF